MRLMVLKVGILAFDFECAMEMPTPEIEKRCKMQLRSVWPDVAQILRTVQAFESQGKTGAFWDCKNPEGPDVSCTSHVLDWYRSEVESGFGKSSAVVLKRLAQSPAARRAA